MAVGVMLGMGGLAFRFVQYLYPVILPEKLVEVPACKLADIPAGGVRVVNLAEGPVILESTGSEIRAFSAICTHLGCVVSYHDDKKELVCPCHGGRYDLDGKVTYGPPPRPLDKLEAKVKDGEVLVLMKSRKEEKV
ncbi:MAG TPA: Rieske (2Fe-2S) protein [Chthoniobacteraceae bacterium]|nr:Rieske (2Fe-2S) protein [Chthoniobacteraceae bacterium]